MKRSRIISVIVMMAIITASTVVGDEQQILTYDQLLQKINIGNHTDEERDPLQITNDDLIQEMVVALGVKDINQIGRYIAEAPVAFDQKISLLLQIINDKAYVFDEDDKMGIILSTANNLFDEDEQKAIFNLLLQIPNIIEKTAFLFIAAHKAYKDVIPTFMTWATDIEKSNPSFKEKFKRAVDRSLLQMLEDDDLDALRIINALTDVMNKKYATALVWYMAHTGKGLLLLKELKALHADLNVVHKGTTPLIEAIKRDDRTMVKALLEVGVDVNKIGDIEIGSPLQQAIAVRDVEIEMLLRYAGAHE